MFRQENPPIARLAAWCLVASLASATAEDSKVDAVGISSQPLAKSAGEGASKTLFERLAPEQTGVFNAIPIDVEHPLSRAYHSSSACSAVALGDLDLDGRLDIFGGNGPLDNTLYLQRAPLKFEDVAGAAGVKGGDAAWAVGSSLADIDNDGDLDIYVCNYDYPNQLFINLTIDKGVRNEGQPLRFEERAAEYGLDLNDGSVVSAIADYDRDGDLDIYILTHQIYREGGRPAGSIDLVIEDGMPEVGKKWRRWFLIDHDQIGDNGELLYAEVGRRDLFFRQNEDGSFTEVSEEVGFRTDRHWGNSATWWDYNYDGWPDLYVGNDFLSPDFLYRNNGDGTFTEVSEGLVRNTTWFSMGAVQSDFNNDGYIDFILGDMLPKTHYMKKAATASMAEKLDLLEAAGGARQLMRNVLHINTGTDRFLEGAWMSGVAATEWTWAIRSADFDNDMLADLFFCNGVPRMFGHADLPEATHEFLVGRNMFDRYVDTEPRREQNLAYRNLGGFQFEDASKSWGLDHLSMSYGASLGDLDGDGHLDLVTSNLDEPLAVYLNRSQKGNRVVVDLEGTQSNLRGIGCLVTAETPDGVKQSRQLFPYGGFLDADEPIIHFGLGANDSIRRLRVEWPSGQSQEFTDLPANRRYRVREPEQKAEKAPAVNSRARTDTWFRRSPSLDGVVHREKYYDDFDRQPLLPLKLSQLGPGQAWGDIDGDGDLDCFLGGAAGQPGHLLKNLTSGGSLEARFEPLPTAALVKDAASEDMGCLFFDADSDGDLDLYVASGGIECEPGDESLQDRLYLNSGNGTFTRAIDALPEQYNSGSTVAAADYDRDGDLDLFVGTRSIPGFYPEPPPSTLLRNDGGRFTAVEHEVVPALESAGMVTSARWSDVNGDRWPDLLVTTDWGPIRLFTNREGRLEETTEAAGLSGAGVALLGWWTGIDCGDLDHDGDIDFVAANLGSNTTYQASLESPELIFYGDFDGSGKKHIVEAQFLKESGHTICYPRRGFMPSADAMPYIAEKMQTYHRYAMAPLTGIYDVERLNAATLFRANRMESTAFLNDGEGRFQPVALPHLAQTSPGFGIALRDIDLDGHLDCYVVQNHFSTPEELGPLNSGLSMLLRGTGDPDKLFEPVWPGVSGLEVPGDAKSLASVDVNRDGYLDFIVGINDDHPELFLNLTAGRHATRPLAVRLLGKPGNLAALGTTVTVRAGALPPQTFEIGGGGSYLGQSSPAPIFAIPADLKDPIEVEVRWNGGLTTTHQIPANAPAIELEPSA